MARPNEALRRWMSEAGVGDRALAKACVDGPSESPIGDWRTGFRSLKREAGRDAVFQALARLVAAKDRKNRPSAPRSEEDLYRSIKADVDAADGVSTDEGPEPTPPVVRVLRGSAATLGVVVGRDRVLTLGTSATEPPRVELAGGGAPLSARVLWRSTGPTSLVLLEVPIPADPKPSNLPTLCTTLGGPDPTCTLFSWDAGARPVAHDGTVECRKDGMRVRITQAKSTPGLGSPVLRSGRLLGLVGGAAVGGAFPLVPVSSFLADSGFRKAMRFDDGGYVGERERALCDARAWLEGHPTLMQELGAHLGVEPSEVAVKLEQTEHAVSLACAFNYADENLAERGGQGAARRTLRRILDRILPWCEQTRHLATVLASRLLEEPTRVDLSVRLPISAELIHAAARRDVVRWGGPDSDLRGAFAVPVPAAQETVMMDVRGTHYVDQVIELLSAPGRLPGLSATDPDRARAINARLRYFAGKPLVGPNNEERAKGAPPRDRRPYYAILAEGALGGRTKMLALAKALHERLSALPVLCLDAGELEDEIYLEENLRCLWNRPLETE